MKGKGEEKAQNGVHTYLLRTSEDLWKEFAQMAEDSHRSINGEINLAMRDRIRKKKREQSDG